MMGGIYLYYHLVFYRCNFVMLCVLCVCIFVESALFTVRQTPEPANTVPGLPGIVSVARYSACTGTLPGSTRARRFHGTIAGYRHYSGTTTVGVLLYPYWPGVPSLPPTHVFLLPTRFIHTSSVLASPSRKSKSHTETEHYCRPGKSFYSNSIAKSTLRRKLPVVLPFSTSLEGGN